MALDGRGYAHIAYYDTGNTNLKYAKWTGSGWDIQTIDSADAASDGQYCSLALDGLGNPHISYSKETSIGVYNTKYAKWTPRSGWAFEDVDTSNSGKNTSIAIDGNGTVHISYDDTGTEILYAMSLSDSSWEVASVYFGAVSNVNSIALDGNGYTHIVYHEPSTWFRLNYSSYPNWNSNIVDGNLEPSRDMGQYNSLAFDSGGRACIAYSSYNANTSNYDLRFATSSIDCTFEPPMGGNSRGKVQAPMNFSGSVISPTQIDWSWSNHSINAIGYRVYCSSAGGNFYLAIATATLDGNEPEGSNHTSLCPNTSYQAYAAAVNAGGVVTSSSSLVWTLANPPADSGVISVSSFSVTLNWSANDNPAYTKWGVLRSTDNFTTSTTTLKSAGHNYTLTSITDTYQLAGNTTYWYKVQAFNESGMESSFDTVVATKTKPASPVSAGAFSGIGVSSFSINWSWADTNGGTNPEDGYLVRRAVDNEILASRPADTTYWLQTGLSVNLSTSVYVEAYNESGTSATAPASAFTLANAPAASYVVSRASSSINIAWSANNNPAYTLWGILRSTDNFITSTMTLKDFSDAYIPSAFSDSGLINEITYWYKVCAYNGAGAGTDYDIMISTFLADIIAPAAVTDLAAGATANDDEINLTWTAPGDDGTLGYINDGKFAIQYTDDSLAVVWSYENAQTVISTSVAAISPRAFSVTGLLYGSTYYFRIWTADAHLNWSEISLEASACTGGIYDNTPPAKITTLNAEIGINAGEIKLSWIAPGDDGISGGPAASYEVRYLIDTGDWDFDAGILVPNPPAPSAPGSLQTMIVSGLTEYTIHMFAIKTYDEAGNHMESDNYPATMAKSDIAVPAIPQNFSGTAQSINTIRWVWGDSVSGVSYKLFNGSGTQIGATLASGEVPYDEGSLSPNTAYSRYVIAYNSGGASTATAVVTRRTIAENPTALTALIVTDHTLNISWTAPGDGAAAYKITRNRGVTEDAVIVVSTTSYSDGGLEQNTQYSYVVQSYNGDDVINSAATASVNVTTQQDVIPPQPPVIDPPANTVYLGGSIYISGYATDASSESFTKVIVTVYDQANRPLATIASDAPNSSPYFTNGLSVSTSGAISGLVEIASNFSEYFPAATSIKIGIQLEDDGENRSPLFITPEIAVKTAVSEVKTKIYNNIIKTPSAANPAIIRYEMPSQGSVSVKLYDLQGRLVKTIFEGQDSTNVKYWYGKNSGGNTVASGVYLLHVKAGGVEEVHKIVVVK